MATAIAEYFRDQGQHVLLMMDSVTRFAMARREIGLAVGEPPDHQGLPALRLRRAAAAARARRHVDAAAASPASTPCSSRATTSTSPSPTRRARILDGHIVLSRRLATRHYPAIDILESMSRVRDQVISSQHLDAANAFLKLEAAHHSHEDLIAVGAYKAGADPMVDTAIALRPQTRAFLQQAAGDPSDLAEACARLSQLASLAAVPSRRDPA